MIMIDLCTGKCQGITITPFSAGHTLGGTIWKIRSPSAGTIVYAVDMNHMRERHLDGTVLFRASAGGIFEPLARPDLFITDADRANVITSRRKDRDAAMIGGPQSRLLYTQPVDVLFSRHHRRYIVIQVLSSVALRCRSSVT